MTQLEADLEALFRARVRFTLGGLIEKIAPTRRGMPDRLVILPSHPGWGPRIHLVELKTDTGRLEPLQREWHARATRLGTEVWTLYGRADIEAWVRDRLHEYDHLLDTI